MIKQWTVSNFKSLQKETRLDLAPLTIFAGANSSGKSTLLQSILLVAQTLAHKVSSASVVLNGSLARLGDFNDVKCADSDTTAICIGWICEPDTTTRMREHSWTRGRRPMTSIHCDVAFDIDDTTRKDDVSQVQPSLASTILKVTLAETDTNNATYSVTLRRRSAGPNTSAVRHLQPDPQLHRLREENPIYDVELDDDCLAEIHADLPSARASGCAIRHFLPQALEIKVDVQQESAHAVHTALTAGFHRRGRWARSFEPEMRVSRKVVEFVMSTLTELVGNDRMRVIQRRTFANMPADDSDMPMAVLYAQLQRLGVGDRRKLRSALAGSAEFEKLVMRSGRHQPAREDFPLTHPLPDAIADAGRYLDGFFSRSVRYLGPLRDEPKALYPLARSTEPWDVGLKGERTAAVLNLYRDTVIKYVPSAAFQIDNVRPVVATVTLGEAVADWLQYLGVAATVETRNRGKFGHELTVGVPYTKQTHDLTHVGVGVSQVLPILVTSLLAESDTTLIFEQPELHMHPRVQTLLADFFLSICDAGKQCIIESHSEYIINRLRLRAATSAETLGSLMKIYFVEKDASGSEFTEVPINEYGAIVNWPKGFFDEGQQEAERILRAAMKKRRAVRG